MIDDHTCLVSSSLLQPSNGQPRLINFGSRLQNCNIQYRYDMSLLKYTILPTLFFFFSLFFIAALSSCATTSSISKPIQELNDGWILSTPDEQGMDLEQLSEMEYDIHSGKYENIDSVVIIRNGKLVYEKYFGWHFQWRKHPSRSVTKTLASILTGIAIDKRFITNVDDKIYPYFSEHEPGEGWSSSFKKISIKNLLNMTSGLECDDWRGERENWYRCSRELHRSKDWIKYVLGKEVIHEPGEHYAYNGTSLILLGEVIAKTSGMTVPEFAEKYLFNPLGITEFRWNFRNNVTYLGSGARLRSRDMAKIGYLFLNGGQWKGIQIISKKWIYESIHRDFEEGPAWDRFKIRHQYLWWSFFDDFNYQNLEGYYSSGDGGQHFMLFPSLDLVIVTTAGNYNSQKSKHSLWLVKDHVFLSLVSRSERVVMKPLNSQQLRDELEGNTFYAHGKNFGEYYIYLDSNGILHGTYFTVQTDDGRWRVTDSGFYCRTWEVWDNGKERCSRVYRKEKLFQFRDVNLEFRTTEKRKKGLPRGRVIHGVHFTDQ